MLKLIIQNQKEAVVLRQLGRRIKTLALEKVENLSEALLDFRAIRDLENWLK